MTDTAESGRVVRAGETCWRTARADRLGVIVDAADYFAAARAAMLQADETIVLIGWDFDLRIRLAPGKDLDDAPNELGPFLKYLVRRKPRLRIFILKWDMAVLFTGNQLLPIFALDLKSVARIRLRFDSKHPWGAAHHQKIAVIDDALAFCGGIDMTVDRWDTREHAPHDERRRRPDGSVAGPWHDATTVVDGAAAQALGEVARARWKAATGRRLPWSRVPRRIWPEGIEPQLFDVDVGIARTMPKFRGRPPISEIEKLYLAAIKAAQRSIYLESQYFASASICDALEARLAEPDGPEVVVINPLSTEGWLEQETMGVSRDLRLASVTRADRNDRFRIYYPVNAAGEPIYVHAKILVVDDDLIRVGSSNVNNRSMGFDTECDLAVEARGPAERTAITALRNDLLAEHLDVRPADIREALNRTGSLRGAIEALRRTEGRSLRPIPRREMTPMEEAVARTHFANPERPADPEARLEHLAKGLVLSVPPEAWVAVGVATTAAAFYFYRRRKKR
ncbi:phospholipase D-like domain-containing protein [Citreimonas salinaria]|uniref:Phospholipase D n=1 Tax=Citreimonas salinaria TaxID=321339 RepID=A0A1H3GT31_9RHOB|nr:phospholipase D-like domain-containing protein [Citreimonas salinaria]SDY06431.1 phospholipase D1/2 [Citreimonas salinaria]